MECREMETGCLVNHTLIFQKGFIHTNEIVIAITKVGILEIIFSLSPHSSNNNLQAFLRCLSS